MHTSIAPIAHGPPLAKARPRPLDGSIPAIAAETLDWRGGSITIRAIRPDDGPRHIAFAGALAAEDIRMRFFSARRHLSDENLERLIHIDPARETAFVAVRTLPGGIEETLGVVRAVKGGVADDAELGIIVRSDLKGLGLGRILMRRMLRHLAEHGPRRVIALVLRDNTAMAALALAHGFLVDPAASDSSALGFVLHTERDEAAAASGLKP